MDGASPGVFRTRLREYCGHPDAREIRMYMPYADSNGVRTRLMMSAENHWRHVSPLYEIPGGWAWTLCSECPAQGVRPARRAAGGE